VLGIFHSSISGDIFYQAFSAVIAEVCMAEVFLGIPTALYAIPG